MITEITDNDIRYVVGGKKCETYVKAEPFRDGLISGAFCILVPQVIGVFGHLLAVNNPRLVFELQAGFFLGCSGYTLKKFIEQATSKDGMILLSVEICDS